MTVGFNGRVENEKVHVHKLLTFDGSGGTSAQLFKLTGIIEVFKLYGHVEVALNANVGKVFFDLFPTGGTAIEITDDTTAGVDISSAPIGSFLYKANVATSFATFESAALGFIQENAQFNSPTVPFILGQKLTVDTFIRLTYAGTGTDGAIDFHVEWNSLSDNGLLVPV